MTAHNPTLPVRAHPSRETVGYGKRAHCRVGDFEELKPEAAYFSDVEGARSAYIVVNMEDASQISAIGQTLLLGLGATIQVHRVMVCEELGQATPAIDQASQKKDG